MTHFLHSMTSITKLTLKFFNKLATVTNGLKCLVVRQQFLYGSVHSNGMK